MERRPVVAAAKRNSHLRARAGILLAAVFLGSALLTLGAGEAQAQIGNPPTVTLTGANPQLILQGGTYSELGATASDPEDGNLTGSIVITGVGSINTNVTGDYTVTYAVTDSDGNSDSIDRTVTVANQPPTASDDNPTVDEDSSNNSFDVLSNDTDPDSGLGDTLTISAVGTPNSGGAVNIVAGSTLSYSPAPNFAGSESFTYTISDRAGATDSAMVTVTVNNINDPPSFASTAPTGGAQGSVYTYDIVATDPDVGDTLTITALTLPSWLTLTDHGNRTATLTGTPTNNGVGNNGVNLQVSDGTLNSTQQFTIVVSNTNDPPTFTSTALTTGTQDTTYTYDVTTDDPDTDDTLTITAPTLPAWLTLTDNGDRTATLSGTPTNDNVGDNNVSLLVSDGTATATQNFIINVTDVNDQPTFTSVAVTAATQNTVYTYNIATDDPDSGDTLSITAPTLPSWLTFIDNGDRTATMTGTPANDDIGGDNSVILEVSDGTLSATQDFTIVIGNVNDPPIPVDDIFVVDEDSAATPFGVLANDIDPDIGDTLTITAVGIPSQGGAVSVMAGGGALTYAPAPDFAGVEAFTYTVIDNDGASAMATVTVTVLNSNDPPSANDDNYSVDEDAASSLDVLANDTDPDITSGDTLTITNVGTPDQGGQAGIAPDGTSLSYIPAENFFGIETFTYTIQDLNGVQATALVTVQIASVNDRPIIAPDPIPDQAVTENVQMEPLDLTQFVTDADGDPLTFALEATSDPLPDGLALSPAGIISGTPTLDTSVGAYTIVFTVTDGQVTTPIPSEPFMLDVLGAGRVDLAVGVAAAPNPATVNQTSTWTFLITNNAPDTPVPLTRLHVVVSGDVPFMFDAPNPACTIALSGNQTQVDCILTDPIPGGGTATVDLTGSTNQAGDVVAIATASVEGPQPVDETPRNDSATATLSISQSTSNTAAQQINGIAARGAATGDLDGDGFADLALATGPSRAVLVFLNVVDPVDADKRAFSGTPITLGAQGATNDIAIVDLDGDGDLDIVAANGAGLANEVFVNDGSTFSTLLLGDSATDSRAVAVADMDGDGFPDLVFANGSPNDLYHATGSGVTFTGPEIVGMGDSRDVALVDLFGNSLPELVLANADGNAQVFSNSGGVFSLAMELPTGATTSVASADFNQDTLSDLAFGRDGALDPQNLSNLVFLNTTTSGNFFELSPLGAAPTADVLAFDADLNGDPDLVFINENGAHQLYVNTGVTSTPFVLHPHQISMTDAVAAAAGSVGADDRVDLIIAGSGGAGVFYNDGGGNFGLGDTDGPIIQLLGNAQVTLTVGGQYTDAGATATDAADGDLTDLIVVDNPVDTSVVGTYTVTYRVTDKSGNDAVPITRTVQITTNAPVGGGGGGSFGLDVLVLLALACIFRWRQRISGAGRTMRTIARPAGLLFCTLALAGAGAEASELSYTYLDFESFDASAGDLRGNQQPVPDQNVFVQSHSGDGIGIAGSLGLGDRFYLNGQFTSSIVDVTGTITSPLTEVMLDDTYDLTGSRFSFGYLQAIGDNLDLLFDVSYDTRQLDFGSLGGENFDMEDTGYGAGVGIRWNPTTNVELFGFARTSTIGEAVLDRLEFQSDSSFQAGARFYFFDDMAIGLDYESAQTDTISLSLRFSFGNLQW